MAMEPPDYDPRFIRRLRPPEVEGAGGAWTSRWVLRLRSVADERELSDVAARLSAEGKDGVELVALNGDLVRLELGSGVHPLDPEAYPLVDRVLRTIDRSLGGIAEINGSPRDWWRTFRTSTEGG